ncbi:CD209 antigen-like protein E [Betta splendens]|uniref:CD209 antigen-like protein E n=1 Tax=Betta splendens TaxID=158456 RepID=A0A6P7LPR5_BETSP|nr:CD209 antigen-like protein E [Betta splendens]
MSGSNFDGGLNKLICEDDLQNEENPPDADSNPSKREVFMPTLTAERLLVVSLAALAAVLLIIDISLGAHYKKLTARRLPAEDIEHIKEEMLKVQNSSKAAIDTVAAAQSQINTELSRQKETNWEFEHQNKRETEYKAQIEKLTKVITSMRTHLPMLRDGCKHCPVGWILLNSVCYYFSFLDMDGLKTWQKAREFCQMYGGDLAIIDSKDKENATVRHLINNQHVSKTSLASGFWIGLRDLEEEGTWKWLDGKDLVEGYWNDGEPNDLGGEDCGMIYANENFFKAWNDARCSSSMKWICEKAPTP